MRRVIKFRAWIKKEYDQCGGFMLYDPDKESTDYFMVSNGSGFAVVFDDEWLKDDMYIIEQFTGLLDKNGKEIFEGDILRAVNVYNGGIFIGPVEYQATSMCRFYLRAHENYHPDIFSVSHKEIEVIGNIHENPELLEKS